MKRIQRKRTRGWRMPPYTLYVGRPTKYGNPFPINSLRSREESVTEYRLWLKGNKLIQDPDFLEPLRGYDLACWCPLNKPCHADVILESIYGDLRKQESLDRSRIKEIMFDHKRSIVDRQKEIRCLMDLPKTPVTGKRE